MWSTSFKCLHSRDASVAKKSCEIVYFRWTKFFRSCALLTVFLLLFQLCSAQKSSNTTNSPEYFTDIDETNSENEETSLREIKEIYPFYENGNLKLKITWSHFAGSCLRFVSQKRISELWNLSNRWLSITLSDYFYTDSTQSQVLELTTALTSVQKQNRDGYHLTLMHECIFGAKLDSYNVAVYQQGPYTLQKCHKNASEHYNILHRNVSYIIIPDKDTHNIFLSECVYKIKITPSPETEFNELILKYTIPGTSVVNSIEAIPFYDKETEAIKVNITWENPTGPLLPTGYHIKISPSNKNKEHCEFNSNYDEVYTSKNITSIILPKNVIPDCSYLIEVEEEPANDLTPPHLNFTVPDCVENHCMCNYVDGNSKPKAPKITVVQISKDVFQIIWKIPKTKMNNITSITFRVALSQYATSPVLRERRVKDIDVGKELIENVTVPNMKVGALYSIHAWYVNASNCESLPARLTYSGQFMDSQGSNHSYQIMVSVTFVLMILFVTCFIWKRRFFLHPSSQWICYWLRGQHSATRPQIRRIYRPTTEGNRTRSYLSIPMEYNNLYVEKEIAEEQERGKADRYEISYTRLEMGPKIGKGAFGQVFLARATAIAGKPGHTTVAVKKLEKSASPEEMEEFLFEIAMLKQIGRHPNIVTLMGCCTIRQPYCMIMEYLPFGDLLHYLRTLRMQYEQKGKAFLFTVNKSFDANQQPMLSADKQKVSDSSYITPESIPPNRLPSVTETEYTLLSSEIGEPATPEAMTARNRTILECVLDPKELQYFALQIARGMQHLEGKQIVHRDLAARNVLIDETKTLKISDFGLSRSGIYVNSRQKKVPLRWLSVEAIRDNLYTSKSDVWAYGVVLWEISTLGGFPYPTVTDHEILKYLLKGERLEKPENCTDELYELMQQCWSHAEDQRPSFSDLVEYLETISSKRRVYVDFNQLNPSYVFPPTEEQNITQIKTDNNIKTIEIVLTDTER